MKQILSCLIVVLISFSAMAEHHGSDDADLNAAIKAFDHAYATNDIERRFISMARGRMSMRTTLNGLR
jgi:hypothetical protein